MVRRIIDGEENPKIKLLSRAVLWGGGRFGSDGRYRSATAILVYLALAKLVIHVLTANNYGYFGDELYWLAMTKHLDFGYVDVPPLVAYLGAIWRFLFGPSMFSIHLLSAMAGAVMVFFAGRLAREMGGGRFAQGLTALMVLAAPCWLIFNTLFAYDPFDQLCMVLFFYQAARLINRETDTRQWLILGLIAGLGLMTKLSMIFTIGAFAVAWVATSRRKSYLTWRPWLAALVALLICVPYLVWQGTHSWPLLTYWNNYARERPHFPPLAFLTQLIFVPIQVTLPLWLGGLYYLLAGREGKNYRALGFIFLILLVFYMGYLRTEPRLFISAFFPLLAAGAVWLERCFYRWELSWQGANRLKLIYPLLILLNGVWLAPLSLPVFPIPALVRSFAAAPAFSGLKGYSNELPLYFAFRLGWPEMVKKVAEVYHSLPEADRKKCVIWAGNYAEAGAIDLLGPKYGLPPAICNHLSYQFWGPGPAATDSQVFILFGTISNSCWIFQEVTEASFIIGHPYAVSREKYLPVYVCREPRYPIGEIWPKCAWFH